MKLITATILAITLVATPALASQPLLFEWSGTDSNSNPIAFSVTINNAQAGDTSFAYNNFDAGGLAIGTESTSDSQLVADFSGPQFAGTYTFPTSSFGDPYDALITQDDSGQQQINMLVGSDLSDIGVTFEGNVVQRIQVIGTANYSFIDASTASSLADLFPVGTYSITPATTFAGFGGEIVWDGGFRTFNATGLTISLIPEPTTAALLALGGLALLRRRRA